ncbi:hypothetical protein BCON_0306g00090 [Botryotinia convoluta]|uniref:Uncharacterized protein n=1 Tax=Botryotinia convoluta TaxID=54673 RepID=A0A4Z1HCC0_9HELO|nr:hypothetical protein BCON_0306g00090 [Botryotinia convoluta]
MELRDRGNASAKTRYSANGPGLWTRQTVDNAPTPEPRNRSEANSTSPSSERKSKRKREERNMRPRRHRAPLSRMDMTDDIEMSKTPERGPGQNYTQNGQGPENRNEERVNGRELSLGDTSADDANDKYYSFGNHRNEPTFLDRIKVLPEMRDLPWREDQELPPERSTESQRVQQRGACMVATRGRIMANPCSHCKQGYGRFSHCIVLEEWFQGACATCIFTSKGNKCSLRIKNLGDQDARALRYTEKIGPSTKRKRSEFEKPTYEEENSIFSKFNSPGHYVSPYPPLPSIPRPPLRTPGLKEAQEAELDSMLQAQIAREELDQGNMDEGEPGANGQQSRATPIVLHRPRFYETPAIKQVMQQGGPPLQNNQFAQPLPMHNFPNNQIVQYPISADGSMMKERSLIDDTPKSTQKQLFTVLSGVAGGLQQLQKELNSLKSVLGWDNEDDEQEVVRQQNSLLHKDSRHGP